MKRLLNTYGALILWQGFRICTVQVWVTLEHYQESESKPKG